MGELALDVIKQWERLKGDRGTTEAHWQDCANYMAPERADYVTQRSPGMKRMQYVYDATPVWAGQQFAAGLHGLLTSTSLQWFYMRCDDVRTQAAAAWLDAVSERMYAIYNGPRHNFASQSHELYLDLGIIGTAVMAQLESARSGILFSTRHMAECVIAENEEDRVDSLTRMWKYTAKQACQAWGQAAGEKVLKAYESTPDKLFTFLHAVRPRHTRDPQRRDRRHKAFESVWVSLEDKSEIDVGGYDEFPYHVPRFAKASGEVYGRGPGMTALPDVKMLNEMTRTVLKAAQKIVDPPLQMPDDGFISPIKTVPGSFNFYRAGTRDRIEPIKTDGNVGLGVEMINALRQQIIRAFFVEWMLMPSNPTDPAAAGKGVTATYVLQQRDEKMRLLGPMLARMQAEFLGPLIDRTFAILWRQSERAGWGPGAPLPPPPPELSGKPLRVEYVSPIAIAQKTSQLDGVARLVQTAMMLGQIDPRATKRINVDGILSLTAKDLHTPALALKSDEQVAAEQQAEADAAAQLNNHQALANVAGAAKDGTAAIKNLADAHAATAGAGGQGDQQQAA